MKNVLFWFRLLFIRSFEGVEKLLKNFDFSEDQSWQCVNMLEKKVKWFINGNRLNLDELLVLLNTLPKDNINFLYCLKLKMALGDLAGKVFVKEIDTINSYAKCNERFQYFMDRSEGYFIRPHYFNTAFIKLGILSDTDYRKIVDDFTSDMNEFVDRVDAMNLNTQTKGTRSILLN